MDFVEKHCMLFEDEEENRLEYTDIHMKFKSLIEGQLEAFIQDLGITQKIFMEACERAQSKIHEELLTQLVAVDDFMLFKQIMVQRNRAMTQEAMQDMQTRPTAPNRFGNHPNPNQNPDSMMMDEEVEMHRAMH